MRKNYNDLTIKFLKNKGYVVERVERYNAFTRKRHDAFGIIDYIALKEGEILGVQSTGVNGKSIHKKTILSHKLTKTWLEAGGKLLLICWRKRGYRYTCDCTDFIIKEGLLVPVQIKAVKDKQSPTDIDWLNL